MLTLVKQSDLALIHYASKIRTRKKGLINITTIHHVFIFKAPIDTELCNDLDLAKILDGQGAES